MNETLYELPEKEPNAKAETQGRARILTGERYQVQMLVSSLEELLPVDHRARIVWMMVEQMDLGGYYVKVKSVEGEAGRPAIDPRILVAVWLYATLEGEGSARRVARRCEEDLAYRWLTGGMAVNYHTLADFRVENEEELDGLLVKGVAALIAADVIQLKRTAQDGLRVRASAGLRSFNQREQLEKNLEEARKLVTDLKEQGKAEGEGSQRQAAAQRRAAEERKKRLEKALEEIGKIEQKQSKSHKKKSEQKRARCSRTDPEARILQMPAGEIRPGYNAQLCVDTESRMIVGVGMDNEQDQGHLDPMLEQIQKDYQRYPEEHLVDGGFATQQDIEAAQQKGVSVLAPFPKPRRKGQDPSQVRESDGPGVRAWRERMITAQAKEVYKQRAATIEWANALARMRGFQQLFVRGMKKARAVLLWFALAHNLLQAYTLLMRERPQAA